MRIHADADADPQHCFQALYYSSIASGYSISTLNFGREKLFSLVSVT
jgi:hypothetical protein